VTPSDQEENEAGILREQVFRELDALGAKQATIVFDGSGDEGQIETIDALSESGSEVDLDQPCRLPQRTFGLGHVTWDSVARAYVYADGDRPMTVRELLDEWAYSILQEVRPGWEIDEGSSGQIAIHVSQGVANCELEARYTASEDHDYEV
jgi:hypothetical protein